MLIITPPGFTPVFVGVRVAHLFSFLCCVLFLSSACVLYTQCCQLAQCLWIVHRFLAHLAFAIVITFRPSSVVRPSTFHILIFSSETTGPIATKLWWNGPWMAPFQKFVR